MSETKLAGNIQNIRPWQKDATFQALKWYSKGTNKHFLINAAPGSGKTICASLIAANLLEKNEIERVVVIAPRIEVVKQWSEEYKTVTGNNMLQIKGSDKDAAGYGMDVCSTWASIQGLLEGYQKLCQESKTLVICDEHHHAAIKAAWGTGAGGAFKSAKYVLILTGTPIRSDNQETTWLEFDSSGRINHPAEGTYNLLYGTAVDLGYCRPIEFHRYNGDFRVELEGETVAEISGKEGTKVSKDFNKIDAVQKALDYYTIACRVPYQSDGLTPEKKNSFQRSMLEVGVSKLEEIQNRAHNAGGLVIAPNIKVAEYMASLLEDITKEKPTLVHSNLDNADNLITAFKNSNKKWIVSVAMISEGVDIKRLRVLVYLPYAQTELAFRQAMGRVVRTLGDEDDSYATVVMPNHQIFEEYATRVEKEMSPAIISDIKSKKTKVCPTCQSECKISDQECSECGFEFPKRKEKYKECINDDCNALNTLSAEECTSCGNSFVQNYIISLESALRVGGISRGMDFTEEELRESEKIYDDVRTKMLQSGDEILIKAVKDWPPATISRIKKIINN